MPSTDLFRPGAGLVLSQHSDDLFLAEATPFHCRLLVQLTDSISI
jgi:hypothetical protein